MSRRNPKHRAERLPRRKQRKEAAHVEPDALPDSLRWPFGEGFQVRVNPGIALHHLAEESMESVVAQGPVTVELFGGDDYNPPGSGWFKPWAVCPECGETIIAWTDKLLMTKIEEHCGRTGCALPKL